MLAASALQVQYRLQMLLSFLFSASCSVFLVWVSDCHYDIDDEEDDRESNCSGSDSRLLAMAKSVLSGKQNGWDMALYGLSLGGALMVVVAVAAVCCHHRGLLRFYLVYIFATLMFCVLYHVFQLDEKMSVWGYTMLALAVLLAILIWAQLYYAMYFLRILDFYDA